MNKKKISAQSAAKKSPTKTALKVAKKATPKTPKKSTVTPKLPVTNKLPSDSKPDLIDDKVGREKMMESLSQILGEMDFKSDAELNAYLDSQFKEGVFPDSLDIDPLDEAQSLIYEAWDTEGPERIKLAERALELSENCADAYLILAKEGSHRSEKKTLEYFEKAVDAGKRAVGSAMFKDAKGAFWGVMETRPFMRAKFELAKYLVELDQVEKAIQHFQEMLVLNPNDNQGVRYILLALLMEENKDQDAKKLLDQFHDDESTSFLYTRALILYRKEGKSKAAHKSIVLAFRENSYVVPYLRGKLKLPTTSPDFISPGGKEEAQEYAIDFISTWRSTEGALEWISVLGS